MKTADLVQQILTGRRIKQEDLAEDLKVTQATISRWLKGSEPRGPVRDALLAMGIELGIMASKSGRSGSKSAPTSRFLMVPLVSWVSAGKLADASTQVPIDDLPQIAVADLGGGEFFGLKVSGQSMNRISPDGSIIIVNRAEKTLHDGKPYVFAVRGEATFKFWRKSPPRLQPFSTDPSEEAIFVDKMNTLEIVGRVRRSILDL